MGEVSLPPPPFFSQELEHLIQQVDYTFKTDSPPPSPEEVREILSDSPPSSEEVEESSSDSPPSLDDVEEILGYKFSNKSLLEEAFTHPSLYNPRTRCMSYERLEFVGAGILDMLIAKELFYLYPDFPPGRLSLLRSANVDSEKLARVAIKHGFHRYLRYNLRSTNLERQIREFSEAMLEYPVHSSGVVDVPKFLAFVVEATIGAIFLDSRSSMLDTSSSLGTVWKITKDLLKPMTNLEMMEAHPMTELQELCQKNKLKLQIIKEPKNKDKTKKVNVLVDGNVMGVGTHSKKDIAQNRAAKDALDNLKEAGVNLDFVDLEVLDGENEVIKEEEEYKSFETSSPRSLDEVEEILGYKFSDKNLLEEAFSHPSYYKNLTSMDPSIMSYERLEFVGDSVISMLMATEVYSLYPDLPHGQLTRLRAANVENEKLARVAFKHGFHHYLRSKGPHLDEQIKEFSVELLEYPVRSNGLIDAPKTLADLVEATIGAVFIDSNYCLDTVWKIIKELLKPMISAEILEVHPMTQLFELCQKNKLKIEIIKDSWNNKKNTTRRVDVLVDDNLVGTGTHAIKKEIAQNRAAKAALDYLKATLAAKNVKSSVTE